MENYDVQLAEMTENVWSTFVGMALTRPADAVAALRAAERDQPTVQACVNISGGWEGAVTVSCPASLARKLAGTVFGKEDAATSQEEVRDIIGEIANMLGGNAKAILPGASGLSLPIVLEATEYPALRVLHAHVLSELIFECETRPVIVTLYIRDAKELDKHPPSTHDRAKRAS